MVTALLVALLPLADGSDPVPADEDVTAGWTALLIFAFLILAVVVLAFSFVKQPARPGSPATPGSTATRRRTSLRRVATLLLSELAHRGSRRCGHAPAVPGGRT